MPTGMCDFGILSRAGISLLTNLFITFHSSEDIEKVTDPRLSARVQIKNLVKQYTKKSDVPPAVNKLNLTLYESQITALLGHNGAGE